MGANDPNVIDLLGHQRKYENVANSIQHNTEPLTSDSVALRVVAIIQAIYRSAPDNSKRIEL